jgi:hypothetical protein
MAIGLLFFLVIGLGRAPLLDVDEGAFSEATREMLSSGDWGHTTLNGADRFDKPIGVYWLQALSAQLFDLNEFAVRLPSALATWLAALAVGHFVMTRWGWRAGALAAVIHATSFGSWAMAHAATADALLGLFLMLSALDLWRYLESGRTGALRRLAIWVGIGIVVKGPVAVLIPAASLLVACVAERRWRPLWQSVCDAWAWLGLLVVSLPWYIYAYERHGQNFVNGFFLRHNLERFSAPMEGHAGGWLYFLVVAPLLWMPWSPLLLLWWRRAGHLWRDLAVRRALIWAGFVFVFFSISGTKLPHYGIYAAPGMVVLLAASGGEWRVWEGRLFVCLLLLWHVLLLALPVAWLHGPKGSSGVALSQDLMHYVLELLPVVLAWLALASAWFVWRRHRSVIGRDGTLAVMALTHALVLTWVIWPWWAHTLQGPIKTLALAARAWPGTVAQVGGNWPSFAFYRQESMVKDPAVADMLLMPAARSSAWPDRKPLATSQGMVVLGKAEQPSKP